MNSKQYAEAIELRYASSKESSDTRCGTCQQELFPTGDKASLSVLKGACRYGASGEDGGEYGGQATPQVDLATSDKKTKASLPLSIEDNDACCTSVCLHITDDQSWLACQCNYVISSFYGPKRTPFG